MENRKRESPVLNMQHTPGNGVPMIFLYRFAWIDGARGIGEAGFSWLRGCCRTGHASHPGQQYQEEQYECSEQDDFLFLPHEPVLD